MSYTRLFALMGAAILVCGSGEASAYTLIKCGSTHYKWNQGPNHKGGSGTYAPRASKMGFPQGAWRTALTRVVIQWTSNPSNLVYGISSWEDTSVGLHNGESEVWWEPGIGAPAKTLLWYDTNACTIIEADIRFDPTVAYTTSVLKKDLQPYGGALVSFQIVAMHEFGHAGGLGHTADKYSIMGNQWKHIHTNGSQAHAYHGVDAARGMVKLYGLWASARNRRDLAVVHWRFKEKGSDGYSVHARTRIFDCSGTELPKVAGTAEPVYRVSRGQCIKLEMTYENMGMTSTPTPTVGYFLSSDDRILNSDTLLATSSLPLPPGIDALGATDLEVLTTTQTLTVPSSLLSGKNYWLGAIINYPPAFSEDNGTTGNNASYVGIRIN